MTNEPRLTALNYLNFLAYSLSLASSITVGTIIGIPRVVSIRTNSETLLAPFDWSYAIWGLIFLSQGIFVNAQLLPRYRGSPLVKKGIASSYVLVCLAQIGWEFASQYNERWPTTVLLAVMSFFLYKIVFNEYEVQRTCPILDFWLLKFPFSMHCGWMTIATIASFNALLGYPIGVSRTVLLYMAFGSLILIPIVAVIALINPSPPEYTIPLVFVWATVSI